MAGNRDEIVGFRRHDADLILNDLDAAGGQIIGGRNRPPTIGPKFGRTKSGGLAANTSGAVFLQLPTNTGWANGPEITAWNRGGVIDGDTLLLLIPIDGRMCAFEVCE